MPRSRRSAWRWLARIALGLVSLVVAAVLAVVIALHTDWGREQVRVQAEAQLAKVFVGGARIGRVEGSPFGELIARDVVINGPSGAPAISVETLRLRIDLLPLIGKRARLTSVIAEGADVRLDRDRRGALEVAHLIRPGPRSGWSVQIDDLRVQRARVELDTGRRHEHLDELELRGSLRAPFEGPLGAHVELTGWLRERAAPVAIDATVRVDDGLVSIQRADVRAGGVSALAEDVRIGARAEAEAAPTAGVSQVPPIAGTLTISVPRRALLALAPELPAGAVPPLDLRARIESTPVPGTPWTSLRITGLAGISPFTAMVRADIAARRAVGYVAADTLDVGALTRGRVTGSGGVFASFDATAPEAGALPTGEVMIHAWGTIAGVPSAALAIALSSDGERANATVDLTGDDLRARATADVSRRGEGVHLHRGTLVARTTDPRDATGGRAPLRGVIDVELAASGALLPRPSLAVRGAIRGKRLGVRELDLSVASLELAIDARGLPARPLGRAELKAAGVVRAPSQPGGRAIRLAELAVTAADRPGGAIDVAVRTRPQDYPWLVEADARVVPGATVIVDLLRHHVRLGRERGGAEDWIGSSGRLAIAPDRIELRDFATRSAGGSLALSGVYHRTGARTGARSGARVGDRAGDLAAQLTATGIDLGRLELGPRGRVDARASVERANGRFTGYVSLAGRGVAVAAGAPPVDADARIDALGDQLTVSAFAHSPRLGGVRIAADLDAPADVTDAAAWRTLDRAAVRTGRIAFEGVELAELAALAALPGDYRGRLDGELALSATKLGGTVQLRELSSPATQDLGPLSVELRLDEPAPGALRHSLTGRAAGLGTFGASAELAVPTRVLDVEAWRRLGRGAIRRAEIRADALAITPDLLRGFGVTSELRGRVSISADLSEGARDARITVRAAGLSGPPLAQPLDLELTAASGDAETTLRLVASTGRTRLLELDGTLPIPLDDLTRLAADPEAARRAPLAATARLPDVSIPALFAVIGRGGVTGGTVGGMIELGGSIAAPTLRARIAAAKVTLPPGPSGRVGRPLDRLTIDARWDGKAGSVVVDGAQAGGTLHATLRGDPRALRSASATLRATRFELTPILALMPGPAGGASGTLDAALELRGLDPGTAKIAGGLHLAEARVPIAPTIGTLRRAKVDLRVTSSGLAVAIDGRLGGGTVKASGTIAMAGASPTGGTLGVRLHEVSPIGTIEPKINANAVVRLSRHADRWLADVTVRNARVEVPSHRGEALKPVGMPADMAFLPAGGTSHPAHREEGGRGFAIGGTALEARVRIYPTRIESTEVRGVVKGNVVITAGPGVPDGLSLVGSIEAERGDVDLFGRRYDVDRAAVRFDGSTDPLLDIRITHDFADVTTITEVRGRLSAPQLFASSTPGIYSQGQLVGFLLGGEPGGDPASANPRDQVTSAGASLVANQLGGYVKRALPIDLDVLRYESATSTTSASVTVGTWLTSALFVAYRRRFDARPDENAGQAEAEYWISRRVMVEGILGDRGHSGLDLLWRKRY